MKQIDKYDLDITGKNPTDLSLNDRTGLALDLYSSFLTDYEAYNDRRFSELAELSFQAADAFITEAKKQITRKS